MSLRPTIGPTRTIGGIKKNIQTTKDEENKYLSQNLDPKVKSKYN